MPCMWISLVQSMAPVISHRESIHLPHAFHPGYEVFLTAQYIPSCTRCPAKRGSRALFHYTLITIVILISLGNTESTWRLSTQMCSEYSNLSAPQLWWWKCCLHWIKVPTPSLLIRWVSPATMQCILPFQCVLSGCTTLAPRFQTQLSEPPWTLRRNTGTFLVAKLSDVTWTPYLNTHATACN